MTGQHAGCQEVGRWHTRGESEETPLQRYLLRHKSTCVHHKFKKNHTGTANTFDTNNNSTVDMGLLTFKINHGTSTCT